MYFDPYTYTYAGIKAGPPIPRPRPPLTLDNGSKSWLGLDAFYRQRRRLSPTTAILVPYDMTQTGGCKLRPSTALWTLAINNVANILAHLLSKGCPSCRIG